MWSSKATRRLEASKHRLAYDRAFIRTRQGILRNLGLSL